MNSRKLILLVTVIILISVFITIICNMIKKEPRKADYEVSQTYPVETISPMPNVDEVVSPAESLSDENSEENARFNPFVDEKLSAYADNVYYGIYYFDDNTYYSCGISERTPSASVIKVFIMDFVYNSASAGTVDLNESINGRSIEALVHAMIQRSDNSATNTLIDRFGMNAINAYIQENGYTETVLERKMLDDNARSNGLDNYTSLEDVMLFLKNMYYKRNTHPYQDMLEIMKGQTIRTKIPQFLPDKVIVANKTGELENVENDIGIVFGNQSAFAIAVLTNHTTNSAQMRLEIGQLAKSAYDFLAIKEDIE